MDISDSVEYKKNLSPFIPTEWRGIFFIQTGGVIAGSAGYYFKMGGILAGYLKYWGHNLPISESL